MAGESPDVKVKNDVGLGCGLHFPASTTHKVDAVITTANNFENIILAYIHKGSGSSIVTIGASGLFLILAPRPSPVRKAAYGSRRWVCQFWALIAEISTPYRAADKELYRLVNHRMCSLGSKVNAENEVSLPRCLFHRGRY